MVIEEKRYGVQEVFDLIGKENLMRNDAKGKKGSNIEVDGFLVHPLSLRYMTFYQKGVVCVSCGKVGTHFKLCGEPETNRRHFNLYADDGALLTKDHIIPKSWGGENTVANLQTMCSRCNSKKADKHPEGLTRTFIVATNVNNGRQTLYGTIKKAATSMVVNRMRPSKKNRDHIIECSINAVIGIQTALETGLPFCGYTWATKEH